MNNVMLTLSEAASRLGVHPTTLRRWADGGDIRVSFTPGGHRRFAAADVQRLLDSGPVSKANPEWTDFRENTGDDGLTRSDGTVPRVPELGDYAISRTRSEISHNHDRWMQLSDEEREEKRVLGRRLMGLLMQFLSEDETDGEGCLAEARAIGRIHARSALQSGMELADVLKATLFFRDTVVESAVLLPRTGQTRPESRARLHRRINTFMNAIQLEIAHVYQP